MGLFRDEQDVYQVLGTFFRNSARNETIGPSIQKSGLVIQFEYADPASKITIDTHQAPDGAYFEVIEGETTAKPDVHMSMKADVANQFWLGKLNLLAALSRRQMVAKGPIPKILKLLPAISPGYKMYEEYLQEIHRPELLR